MTELHEAPGAMSAYRPFQVLLDPPREQLEENIARRSERMLAGGWTEEVERLLADGLPEDAPGLQSLGYAEVVAHLQGKMTRDELLEAVKRKTRQYAKRQRTWFNNRPTGLRIEQFPVKIDRILARWEAHLEKSSCGD